MAKNRGNKRKASGGLTRNQKRKAAYAAMSGWKHGSKGSRASKKRTRLVRTRTRNHVKSTECARTCRQCYPGGIFAGAPCARGRLAA
jgi:hypothetical protein